MEVGGIQGRSENRHLEIHFGVRASEHPEIAVAILHLRNSVEQKSAKSQPVMVERTPRRSENRHLEVHFWDFASGRREMYVAIRHLQSLVEEKPGESQCCWENRLLEVHFGVSASGRPGIPASAPPNMASSEHLALQNQDENVAPC
jgi:hypothetical protein